MTSDSIAQSRSKGLFVPVSVDMMNDWHVAQLARALDVAYVTAAGIITLTWTWVQKNAPDGDLTGVDPCSIAFGIRYTEDADTLISALIASEVIDRDESGRLTVHDWHDHGGRLNEKRVADAERKRRARQAEDSGAVRETSDASPPDVLRMSAGRPPDKVRTSAVVPPDNDRTSAGRPVDLKSESESESESELPVKTPSTSSTVSSPGRSKARSAPARPAIKPDKFPRNDNDRLVEWWADYSGAGLPTVFGKAISAAKRLTDAGLTLDDAPDLYQFCAGFMDGVTLEKMLSQFDAWKAAKAGPARRPASRRRGGGYSASDLVAMVREDGER